MLSIQIHNDFSSLPFACKALFFAGEKDSFDLSADWFQLLVSHVFSVSMTRIYVMQRDGEVRGVMPLCVRQRWLRQTGSLTNYYSSLYRPLLDPAVTDEELAGYLRLMQQQTRLDVLRFDAMDTAHPSFALLASALHLAGLKPYRFKCFTNWYLPVQTDSFQAYFEGLSAKVRNTVRRREKKFFTEARGRLEIVSAKDALNAAIAAWEKIYAASWKQPEPYPAFVPALIRLCAAHGWLRLGLAYYDGEAIAAQLWIVSHGRAAIYKLAYDEKFAHLSVGTILTAHLMRHVLDVDKVQEVDYLIGDDEYKKDWMKCRRERWGMVVYNPRTVRGLIGGANEASRRAVKAALAWLKR